MVAERSCVAFTMADGIELFHCSVSFSALDGLDGGLLSKSDLYLDLFAEYRSIVEAAASRLFDAGVYRSDGIIAMGRHQLPPVARD